MFRNIFTILVAISAVLVEPICSGGATEVSQALVGQDPRLQLASQARQAIEKQEIAVAESVDALLTQLDTAITKLPSETLEQEQLALEHLKQIAAALREQSEAVLSKRESYARNFESLQEALEDAPAAFRKAAEAFHEYAEKEPFEDIKAVYLSLAETWKGLATKIEERAKEGGGPDLAEWDESCRYIESIATFAKRLEEHLGAFPDADWLNRQQRFSSELQTLIKRFSRLQQLLKQFNSQLTTEALAEDLRESPTEPFPSANVQLAAYVSESSAAAGRPVPSTVAELQRQSVSPAPTDQQSNAAKYVEFFPWDPQVSTNRPSTPKPQQPRWQNYPHPVPRPAVGYVRYR
jgi:hypothetical protein